MNEPPFGVCVRYLFDPNVCDHDLPLHVDADDLRKLQTHFHRQTIGTVPDRTNESAEKQQDTQGKEPNLIN